jgi:hypothetical protein
MKSSNTIHQGIVGMMLLALLLISGCWGGDKSMKAYSTELSSSDSMTIQMGNFNLLRYHSPRLGFDINYPSFLTRQDLPESAGLQEIFIMDDVSVSFMVDSLNSMIRSSGQTLMAMGADLVDVGDDYTIHDGQDDKWEYYSKVISSDSLRQVTIILRYYPEHAEAMEPLKEWIRDFQVTP